MTTTCCIVGGGPAGIFFGYLLARSGVGVIVLEKHADFLRDFREDTVHQSAFTLLTTSASTAFEKDRWPLDRYRISA